jgi:hypothetical protein
MSLENRDKCQVYLALKYDRMEGPVSDRGGGWLALVAAPAWKKEMLWEVRAETRIGYIDGRKSQ